MTIEHAIAHLFQNHGASWTCVLGAAQAGRHAAGEIWYERSGPVAAAPSLLLKLLFTDQPLSIQVHPDDTYARSIGLFNGKTEAWYVLSASPEAEVSLGLKRRLTSQQIARGRG